MRTITTAGVILKDVEFKFSEDDIQLGDDLECDLFEIDGFGGDFDANDHNLTAEGFHFYSNNLRSPTVVMGSGTWQGGAADAWYIKESGGSVTITPETSTIKLVGTGEECRFDNDWASKTYNNIWVVASGTNYHIEGSNTFNEFKITGSGSVKFLGEGTTTVTTFVAEGTDEGLITLDNTGGVDQFILSCASGIIECDYLDISNSNATGGARWFAGANSIDTENNDGWIFTDRKYPLPPFRS